MPCTAPSRARITSSAAQSQPSTRTGWFESANCLRATEWQTARRPPRDPTHNAAGYRNPAGGNARGAGQQWWLAANGCVESVEYLAMPRRRAGVLLLASLLAWTGSGCAGIAAGRAPVSTPVAAVASPGVARPASPGPSPSPVRTATPIPFSGPTFILIRAPDITAGARLNFQGQGFLPSEQATATIED